MRKQIMDGLRKAGQGMRNFDEAYSAKVGAMYKDAPTGLQTAAYVAGGATPSFQRIPMEREIGAETRGEQAMRRAAEYAVPIANAVPKYVLPAAGVTMAGQALIDLTSVMMNQQTESAIMPN